MLIKLMAMIPKFVVRPIARNYIAGETTEDCVARGRDLNDAGWGLAIDLLGEHSDEAAADDAVRRYRELIDAGVEAKLDFGLSVKLSHIGSRISDEMAKENLKRILSRAQEHDLKLTIDMESSKATDATLATYGDLLTEFDVECVVQAYLRRSQADVDRLLQVHDPKRIRMRVCKGIYIEPKDLIVGNRDAIRENYIRLAETLYDGGAYVQIATHDEALLDHFEAAGWDPSRFEFQILMGVPVNRRMQELRDKGYRTVVYLPYGPEWHAYSMRRLSENPRLIRYVIGNLFRRR